jgi:rRNA maturation endonuclease Nob1
MKIENSAEKCINCHSYYLLQLSKHNYCPWCGPENNFRTFVKRLYDKTDGEKK